ncbi:MAG: UDP-N-acetylmuramoyl-L-alanyl-D-glutamate--2,6-diaminopimelate ligase, partial [Prevotellaceae bacterium]|nr:UDP-N-acetylmuramoyl-L-alanyl-D-glutamate--2,6-diaminopimelate ligase [Prevotellaceae bacterium]
MKLSKILKNISVKNQKNLLSFQNLTGLENIEINNIQFDSRKVERGDLFVATRGTAVDGHDFIEKAIENGAVAVVCEKTPEKFTIYNLQFTILEVENSLEALGKIASNFYGNPSQKLKLVGVTGTNGKTTIATLLYRLTMSFGIKTGLLSTVCNYICSTPIEATHTTPDSLELNRLLAEMVKSGCEYCFMEVSSHAVVQHRISGLEFAGGIFTNLTRDHLDYHGTMENYRDAKK